MLDFKNYAGFTRFGGSYCLLTTVPCAAIFIFEGGTSYDVFFFIFILDGGSSYAKFSFMLMSFSVSNEPSFSAK